MKHSKNNTIPPKPLYVPKVTRSVILVCVECKSRYIKTRKEQSLSCLKCFIKARDLTQKAALKKQ